MTPLGWVGVLAGAWCGVAVALALGIGKAVRIADRAQEAVDEPREWSDAAVRFEFDLLVPSLVTEAMFADDAEIDRKSRGAW